MSATEIADLTRRLQRLEDERDVREVMARYGHFADLGYEDAYVNLFTEDGVYDIVTVMRKGAGYSGNIRFEGRAQLYEEIRDPRAHKQFEGRCLHFQDINAAVTINGDEAVADAYSMTVLKEGDDTVIRTAGMNRWKFRRINGQWKITEKRRRPPGDKDLFPDIDKASVGGTPG